MATTYTYDCQSFVLLVGGIRATGLAEDGQIEISRDEDAYKKYVGCGGEVTRSKSRNRSGSCKIKVQQSAAFNAVLSAFAAADEANDEGVFPLVLKDTAGLTTAVAGTGWIKKLPKLPIGKEVGELEWEIDLSVVEIFIAGSSKVTEA